jgi:hypothetical protein
VLKNGEIAAPAYSVRNEDPLQVTGDYFRATIRAVVKKLYGVCFVGLDKDRASVFVVVLRVAYVQGNRSPILGRKNNHLGKRISSEGHVCGKPETRKWQDAQQLPKRISIHCDGM